MTDKESVDRICEQIREDGAKEVNSIVEKARRSAAEIMAKAEAEAKKIGERIVKESAERGELGKKRALSSVNLEVRRIRLRAREEAVSAALERVRSAIDGGRGRPDYADVLARLTVEALRALDGGDFVVYADRRDVGVLESKVLPLVRKAMEAEGRAVASLAARPLDEESAGGVRVGVPGGNVIYDNTFEARMYRFRDDVRALIFEGVFSAEDRID